MKRDHLILGFAIFVLMFQIWVYLLAPVLAANNPTKTDNTVSVVLDGTTAFSLCATSGVPTPVFLEAIIFKPSAANDYIQVRDGGASGAIIWPANVDVTGAGQVLYYNGLPRKPYIVGTECHFGTAANALVTFIYSNR